MEPASQADDVRPPAAERFRLLEAQRRVAAIKGFYIHLFVFAAVILGLLVVDVATGPGWWVQWVFLGWGIGILAHALGVYGRTPKALADWEERKVRQLMEKR